MKYKYVVYKKQCPYCCYTLDEDWHEALAPFLGCFVIFLFPVFISCWLIWRFGFSNPNIPKVGDKVIACPNCSLPIKTNKVAIEDLTAKELLVYRFRAWFIVCFVIDGVFTISSLWLLVAGLPIASWLGLISLLSLLGVAAIIITYRVKLGSIK